MIDMMTLTQKALVRDYRELNKTAVKGQTVLAGSSLMENFRVNELLMSRGCHKIVYNRGIGGMTVREYDQVLDVCVLDLEPAKLILNIGSNDLNIPGDTVANLMADYRPLLGRIRRCLPDCRITLLAYYPCRKGRGTAPPIPGRIARTMDTILAANEQVRLLAKEYNAGFRDFNEAVSDSEGYLDPKIAMDDIHFSQAGYIRILDLLEPLL